MQLLLVKLTKPSLTEVGGHEPWLQEIYATLDFAQQPHLSGRLCFEAKETGVYSGVFEGVLKLSMPCARCGVVQDAELGVQSQALFLPDSAAEVDALLLSHQLDEYEHDGHSLPVLQFMIDAVQLAIPEPFIGAEGHICHASDAEGLVYSTQAEPEVSRFGALLKSRLRSDS